MRVGLIGLGNAGRALLQALSRHAAVVVHDRDSGRLAGLEAVCTIPAVPAPSAEALAAGCDLILLSLPSPEASLAVAEEISPAIGIGTMVIETSTVRPEDVEALHDLLSPTGARVLDAAIVGGVHKLAEGKGVFLIGAAEADAGIAGEVLGAIAEELFWLGGRGRGMRAKLAVNAVAHGVFAVLVEAGALAAAQDIPMATFRRLMERESGVMRPMKHRFGERLLKRDFAGGMSTANARKDSALILDTARQLGVPLFALQGAHSLYEVAMREGLGPLDYAALGQLYEKWLGIEMREPGDV
jgi:3-hydroxyisobutyrate dehydrogenase-like beta-hydroxyacid dehydrogenase